MTTLLPRLPEPAADLLLDHMLSDDGLRWSGFDPFSLPEEVRYGPTGGTTIAPSRLRDFRNEVVGIASEWGFPDPTTPDRRAGFDAELAQWAALTSELNSGEALRNDVWSFLAIVLAPDVVHWRFGNVRERYMGGIRNAFQRGWLRAKALDRGPSHPDRWGLLRELSEDALVQITERPSISANPIFARELAEAWKRAAARYGRSRMEDVMRLVTLRLRMLNEIRELALLPQSKIAKLIDTEFERAAAIHLVNAASVQLVAAESAAPKLPIDESSSFALGTFRKLRALLISKER